MSDPMGTMRRLAIIYIADSYDPRRVILLAISMLETADSPGRLREELITAGPRRPALMERTFETPAQRRTT